MNHVIDHKSKRHVGTIADVGTILAYLALSEGGFGPTNRKVGTIQGWIWVKNWQRWHYPRVDLGQNLAKLALSEGGSGPKFGKVGTIAHVGTIQGWTWAQSGQSA